MTDRPVGLREAVERIAWSGDMDADSLIAGLRAALLAADKPDEGLDIERLRAEFRAIVLGKPDLHWSYVRRTVAMDALDEALARLAQKEKP